MSELIERLYKWHNGEPQFPTKIEFFPTDQCNSLCVFCHRRDYSPTNPENELAIERVSEIIEESAEMGVLEWHLIGGGEPLFYADRAFKIIEAIKSNGIYGYLNTNGILVTDEIIEMMIDKGWDYIKFSLHGDPEIHDSLTCIDGAYEKVTSNIRKIINAKKNSKSDKPYIELGPVLNRKNFRSLSKMAALAVELGVNDFRPQSLNVYNEAGRELKLRDEDRSALNGELDKAIGICAQQGITTNLSDFLSFDIVSKTDAMNEVILESRSDNHQGLLNAPCLEPWYHLTIHSDGKVGVCGFTHRDDCIDLADRTLKELWYSPNFESLRRKMLKGELHQSCAKCVSVLVMHNRRLKEKLRQRIENGALKFAPKPTQPWWRKIFAKIL